MKNLINHPEYYNRAGRKECIIEMLEKYGKDKVIAFCELNAYKYDYRKGLKDGNTEEQDKQKSKWYQDKAEELKGEFEQHLKKIKLGKKKENK